MNSRDTTTVVFVPDRALVAAIDPAFARWKDAWREPLLRAIRESSRARRKEQARLYGRPHTIPEAVRKVVYRRDGGTCVRCGALVGPDEWRCHHVVPYPEGPESVENLVTLCIDCHEWLHYGFLDSATDRLRAFRRWWYSVQGQGGVTRGPVSGG